MFDSQFVSVLFCNEVASRGVFLDGGQEGIIVSLMRVQHGSLCSGLKCERAGQQSVQRSTSLLFYRRWQYHSEGIATIAAMVATTAIGYAAVGTRMPAC